MVRNPSDNVSSALPQLRSALETRYYLAQHMDVEQQQLCLVPAHEMVIELMAHDILAEARASLQKLREDIDLAFKRLEASAHRSLAQRRRWHLIRQQLGATHERPITFRS